MSLKIIKAGIFDTVQDAGRNGLRHLGINPNGAMDAFSSRLANALLGKSLHAPVLELHYPASVILFEKPTILCLTGGNFTPVINGQEVHMNQPVYVPSNSVVEFKNRKAGRWCYLALIHDIEAEEWLGSVSTNVRIKAGGLQGRALKKNDCIGYKKDIRIKPLFNDGVEHLHWQAKETVDLNRQQLHFLKGNEWNWLSAESIHLLESEPFQILQQSERMGYRLAGTALTVKEDKQLISSAVSAGTMQLLPNGQIIVLMADHQTTGGYPRIGHLISVDLSVLAQQHPGTSLRFSSIHFKTAEQQLIQQLKYLEQLKITCTFNIQNYIDASL